MPDSIHSIVRKAEENYTSGSSDLGKYVSWSMYETVEKIFAYLNSKFTTGDKDSLGRDKPFFNIVSAAVNIWYRATDIDRKDIRFVPKKQSSVVLAFVANILLQNWMDKARFGVFLNEWGRVLAQYGGAVRKFVEVDGELKASVIPWNRIIPDPVDFDALPRIEKFYKTPGQLQNMATPGHPSYAGYNKNVVEKLCTAVSTRKNIGGQQKDNMSEFIELYEVHGLLDARLLEDEPDHDDKNARYVQQMHVVSFVGSELEGYDDFTVYKGKEKKDVYGMDALIKEDGRTLPIGAVEYLFDSQWMQNHSMKAWKDNMDLASKMIFQTSDTHFVNRNVLTAVESGDILIHAPEKPLTKVANDEYDLTNIQGFQSAWRMIASELTSTPDAIKGNTLPSGTPYSLGAYLGQQANSLFEIMTENKGLAIEDMMREYVIPHLKKQLKNKNEIAGMLDDAGVQEIDSVYVPREAVKRFNDRTIETILSGGVPSPFNQVEEEGAVKQELNQMGNKRFFTPDELSDKQWDEVFSDFEWENIRVEVVNENTDKQAILQTLSSVFQTIASNPAVLQDPNARMVFSQILSETGRLSPIQFTQPSTSTVPVPAGGTEGISKLAEVNGT